MSELLNPTTILALVLAAAIALALAVKLSKDPSFGVILIAFFLPFERIPSLDFAGFTFKINHFIGGLTLLFWLLAVIFARRKIAPHPFGIPLLLLFFSFFLSGLGAENQFRQYTVFISLLIMLGIHLAVLNGVVSETILRRTVAALFAAAGLMGIVGIYQFFGDIAGLPTSLTGLDPGYTKVVFSFPRVHSFSKEPLYYANYLFIPLGVALALFFAKQKNNAAKTAPLLERLSGPLLLPLLVLLFINFFLTLSRGAFIAFVPFALIFAFFYARQIFTLRNMALFVLILTVSLSAVFGILKSASPEALERFIGHAALQDVLVQKTGESGFGRLHTFTQALDAWKTSPVLGVGLGNFGPYAAQYPTETPGIGWQIVNNEYLELLAETGLLGLSLWLLFACLIFGRSYVAYKRSGDKQNGGGNEYARAVLVGLTAALAAMLVQYNFFSTLYIIHVWVLLALIIGVQNLILTPERLPEK